MSTPGDREKLIIATKVNDKIVDSSTVLDEPTKWAFKDLSRYTRDFLKSYPKANAYQLKSLTSALLTQWNESLKPDTEAFWAELISNDVDFERKDPLRFAVEKNRFRNVEQGIDARNYWSELKKLVTIKERFTETDIEKIDKIITEDEKSRLDILKKCLRKKGISNTQYLKFGECMAYFANCKLFGKYFRQEEVEELYSIWKGYKFK